MRIRVPVLASLLAPILGGAASAQSEGASAPVDLGGGEELWFSLEGVAWFPALTGDLRLRGNTNDEDVEDLGIDDPQAAPYARLAIGSGRFTFRASGFGFGLDESGSAQRDFSLGGLTIGQGERFDSELDYASVQALGLYEVWRTDLEPVEGGIPVSLKLDLGGGVRFYDLDATFRSGAGETRSDHAWIEPIAAAGFRVGLGEDFDLNVDVSAGGLPLSKTSSTSFDVTLAARWRFVENAGLLFGYRFLSTDLSDGDGADEFSFDGSLAGLYAGLMIRF